MENPYFCHMKFLVKITLLFFVLFLSTPTIVSVLDKGADTSIAFNFTEEEVHKEVVNEVNANIKEFQYLFIASKNQSSKINSENSHRHENAFGETFSPPPEFI